ncbi:UNVERIFIED_CONTAM: hypothetical protein Slati_1096200 [Sesamum latifolium]|uniref:Uncharacterized protein n=1 Tax=Sesamum latifolium TaxID=2727402 RepID=A0AAW2XG70_9LAMI
METAEFSPCRSLIAEPATSHLRPGIQRSGIQRPGIQQPGTSDLVSSDPDQRPGIQRPGPETWYPVTRTRGLVSSDLVFSNPEPATWYPATQNQQLGPETWYPATRTRDLVSSDPDQRLGIQRPGLPRPASWRAPFLVYPMDLSFSLSFKAIQLLKKLILN